MASTNANPATGDGGARQKLQSGLTGPASNSQNTTDLQVRRLVRDFGLTLHVAGVVAEHAFYVGVPR
jgi:hypothetical protein